MTLLSVGYFLLLGELSLGKTVHTDFLDGIEHIAKKNMASHSKLWKYVENTLQLTCAFLMNIIYVVVIGWILFFCVQNLLVFMQASPVEITSSTFESLTKNFEKQLFWSFCSLLLAAIFLCKNSIKLLEKLSAVFVPSLIFILIYLTFWSLSQTGAGEGALQVIKPDFVAIGFSPSGFDITRFLNVILAVIEQVVYSLSIGMGVAYIYGTYTTSKINLISATKYVIALDTVCSLLAAVFVLSISSTFGVPQNVGSALTFVSLPLAFEQMIGGSFVMFLFYGIFFVAALTTLISLYEPLVSMFAKKFYLSRSQSFCAVATANFLIVTLVLMSSSGAKNLTLFGRDLFTIINSFTNTMLLISALTLCIFIGWIAFDSIYNSLKGNFNRFMTISEFSYTQKVLRFIGPFILIVLLLKALLHF